MELLRSLMFVPGHRPRMVQRALGLGEFTPIGLDVAILDLEDGVPLDEKDRARAAIAAVLGLPSTREGPARYVRVNRDPGARDADLAAVLRPGLEAIVAPKIDQPDEVTSLARDLDEREDSAGMKRGSIRIVASIESARGLLAAHAIAASTERVIALLFGAAKQHLKIVEMPIRYRDRTYGETKISRFRHGWLLVRMTAFVTGRKPVSVPLRDNAFAIQIPLARFPANLVAYDSTGHVIQIDPLKRPKGL